MGKTKNQRSKRGVRQAPDKKRPRDDWHTMFYGALELILDSKLFSFNFQHELTKEPLEIDAIIVKKLRDVESAAKIAKLFLRDNIVEFKGPDDYVSIEDFYKMQAYANLYRSTTKTASIRDMTLTFVEKRYPLKLIKHLEEELSYRVELMWPGIYYVIGGQFPVQLIETKRLEDVENIWLRHLDKRLGVKELAAVMTAEYDEEKHEAHTRYIQPLARANQATVQEASMMSERKFDEFMFDCLMKRPDLHESIIRKNGLIPAAVFEAERRKTIQKLNKKGFTDTEIAEVMELDLKTIHAYIADSL